jgi:hypothetical protein
VVGAHPLGTVGDGSSHWCRRPLRYPAAQADPDAFADWLTRTCRDESIDVVLPVDEDLVRLLAVRRPELDGAVPVGPTAEQYAALCDKRRLVATARAAGVDHPDTITVSAAGPDGPWPALPSIIKPVISHSDMSVARITMALTEEERAEQVGRLLAAGLDALVQERVVGRRWVGHCVRGARGIALVPSRIELDYPRGTGVACVQRTTSPPGGLEDAVARLLAEVGYRGPATISFLQRGDRLFVHDVNLRIGASVGLLIRSGLDVPRLAVESALGVPADGPARWRWTPTRYVWLDGELGALRDALRSRGGEAPLQVAGRMIAAALLPGRMTDPHALDPWWLRARLAALRRRR